MLLIENDNISVTRGNVAILSVGALNDDETDYVFQVGDVVRFKVFKNKDCGCVELQKDVVVERSGTTVDVELTSEDTKIGTLINKPVSYWYEVELNPDTKPQTIIGYDKGGAKIFELLPEGGDKE